MAFDFTDLTRKAARAFGWSMLRSAFEQGFAFLVFLVLARLLAPEDFGLIAIAAAIIELLRLLSWAGMPEVVIRAPQLSEEMADTAFWTNAGVGLALAGLTLLGTDAIAAAFRQPALAGVMQAMALIIVVSALGGIHNARLIRNFGHKALAMRALAANLAGGIVGIAVALAGGGVWALVAQRLAAETVQTLAMWVALRWVPRPRYRPRLVPGMVRFGAGMTVTNVTNIMTMRVQEALVGLYLPVAAAGYFRVGNRIIDLITQLAFMPAHQAALPSFAQLQENPRELGLAFLGAIRLAALVAFPAFLGLAAVAPQLVPLALGEQWRPSVPVLQALSLIGIPLVLDLFLNPVLVAVGHSRDLAIYSVIKIALATAFTLAALPHGVAAVAAALALRGWITVPMVVVLLRRACGLPWGSLMRALWPPLVGSGGMAAATLAVGLQAAPTLSPAVLLMVQVAFGAVLYVLIMLTLGRAFVSESARQLLPVMPVPMREWLRRAMEL